MLSRDDQLRHHGRTAILEPLLSPIGDQLQPSAVTSIQKAATVLGQLLLEAPYRFIDPVHEEGRRLLNANLRLSSDDFFEQDESAVLLSSIKDSSDPHNPASLLVEVVRPLLRAEADGLAELATAGITLHSMCLRAGFSIRGCAVAMHLACAKIGTPSVVILFRVPQHLSRSVYTSASCLLREAHGLDAQVYSTFDLAPPAICAHTSHNAVAHLP